MQSLGQFILSVVGAALIYSILTQIPGMRNKHAGLIKIICGVFMILCVAAPLADISITDMDKWELSFAADANAAAQEGLDQVNEKYKQVIMEQTRTYILDKAKSLGSDVEVSVVLDESALCAPRFVTIKGSVSPYNKQLLSVWIAENIGIAKEDQKWIG